MNLSRAIMATVCYHDVFNYPLAQQQIFSFLIDKKTDEKALDLALRKLVQRNILVKQEKYFFLKNRKEILNLRKKRIGYSASKLKKAKIYAELLKTIPTIRFVGISGALSMENSTKFDDIDFVIISRRNWLWTSRFLTNALLFAVKRRPGSQKTNNRACLNLFFDESDLKIKDENVYQAHEICQLKPIWQRNNAYYRFIKANSWAKKYLPNWKPVTTAGIAETQNNITINNHQEKFFFEKSSIINLLGWIETLAKKLQLSYMRSRITTEQIGEYQLFFHPSNAQDRVLKEYQKRLKSLEISS